jgi:hypothetical protein
MMKSEATDRLNCELECKTFACAIQFENVPVLKGYSLPRHPFLR